MRRLLLSAALLCAACNPCVETKPEPCVREVCAHDGLMMLPMVGVDPNGNSYTYFIWVYHCDEYAKVAATCEVCVRHKKDDAGVRDNP